MYATLKATGEFEQHEGIPTLEQMQKFVAAPGQDGALVEVVGLKHGIDMWINEEGKYVFGEPVPAEFVNKKASMYAAEAGSIDPRDFIVGDVLFTGGADEDGETVGLTEKQMAYVAQAAKLYEMGRPGSGVWNFTGIDL